MSELFKEIIDIIKKWNIKRKSEDVLCPFCSYNYHKLVKWIDIYPIYSCNRCHALFNYDGTKLKTPLLIENAPENFTFIYKESDIKKIPFPRLTKEEEQGIVQKLNDFVENQKEDE